MEPLFSRDALVGASRNFGRRNAARTPRLAVGTEPREALLPFIRELRLEPFAQASCQTGGLSAGRNRQQEFASANDRRNVKVAEFRFVLDIDEDTLRSCPPGNRVRASDIEAGNEQKAQALEPLAVVQIGRQQLWLEPSANQQRGPPSQRVPLATEAHTHAFAKDQRKQSNLQARPARPVLQQRYA